ncbi:unnamed protein product [Brassica rapa]|uniref:Uncharacterized protein n=2 Tax=Brassica TaxID=3705 RepID=A0A8D9GZ97_BRACM|nr:unnamed protein product [Brassica napus]CAG7889532.1 unnamed protein product [Brassica rapa]
MLRFLPLVFDRGLYLSLRVQLSNGFLDLQLTRMPCGVCHLDVVTNSENKITERITRKFRDVHMHQRKRFPRFLLKKV